MKYLFLALTLFFAVTGCDQTVYYTNASCVSFDTNLDQGALYKASAVAAPQLGYSLIDDGSQLAKENNQPYSFYSFEAKKPTRAMIISSGLNSGSYFISVQVKDPGHQTAASLDS